MSPEALDYAFERVETFARVNQTRNQGDRVESVEVLWDFLGLPSSLRSRLADWLDSYLGEDAWDGQVLLGLLIGLFIYEHEARSI